MNRDRNCKYEVNLEMIVTKEETLSIRAYLREESRHSKQYWN